MITLYNLLSLLPIRSFDTVDTEYDAVVTVEHIPEPDDDYDKFCNAITERVIVREAVRDYTFLVNWCELIRINIDVFRAFTKKYWCEGRQCEDDEDEFIYQWICEIHNYIAGYVSEDFYAVLLEELVDKLG